MKKAVVALIMASVMMMSCFNITAYMNKADEAYVLHARNAIAVNTNTGRTVFEKRADEKVPVASLTKIMTAMVVIENCNDLDDVLEVNKALLDELKDSHLANVRLVGGEQMNVRDLLFCLLLCSAADASLVLAENFGGSVAGFVDMMNAKAAELELKDTHFVNTHGLDAEGHYSTARDMARLAEYAIADPLFGDIVSTAEYTVGATNKSKERKLKTSNLLISEKSDYYYKWADGVKTGYTGDAGRCLCSTAMKDGVRYICIVLGCEGYNADWTIACDHFTDSIFLLDKCFAEYEMKQLSSKGQKIVSVPVKSFGIDSEVSGVLNEDLTYLVGKEEKVDYNISLVSEKLTEPVAKGEKLGVCDVLLNGEVLKTFDIFAGESVNRDWEMINLTIILCAAAVCTALTVLCVVLYKKAKRRREKEDDAEEA